MIKSISRWSLPSGPLDECARLARRAGFEGIELSFDDPGDLDFDATAESAAAVAALVRNEGLQIAGLATGLLWSAPLTSGDTETRDRGLAIVRKMLDVASWLEVDAILVVPGAVDVFFLPDGEVVPYDVAWDRATEAIGSLVPLAEERGVAICLENVWNRFLLSPLEMKQFIDQFSSPWVRSYFDVGNVLSMGYPEHWIAILGSRIHRVHFKDFRRSVGTADGFVDLGAGDVNWPEVMRALEAIGYDGFVTAEMLPAYKHFPTGIVQTTSRAMDLILGRET